jgi:hypothetical protein
MISFEQVINFFENNTTSILLSLVPLYARLACGGLRSNRV